MQDPISTAGSPELLQVHQAGLGNAGQTQFKAKAELWGLPEIIADHKSHLISAMHVLSTQTHFPGEFSVPGQLQPLATTKSHATAWLAARTWPQKLRLGCQD